MAARTTIGDAFDSIVTKVAREHGLVFCGREADIVMSIVTMEFVSERDSALTGFIAITNETFGFVEDESLLEAALKQEIAGLAAQLNQKGQ